MTPFLGGGLSVHFPWRFKNVSDFVEATAQRFLASGAMSIDQRKKTIRVMITALAYAEACDLRTHFDGGTVSEWKQDGTWTWQTSNRKAMHFLVATAPWVQFKAQPRSAAEVAAAREVQEWVRGKTANNAKPAEVSA